MKLFFPLERSSFATLALFVLIAIAALAPAIFITSAGSRHDKDVAVKVKRFGDFDIRTDKDSYSKVSEMRGRSGKTAEEILDLRSKFGRGEEKLRGHVPNLKVEYSTDLKVPEVIAADARSGRQFLTPPGQEKRSEKLRGFLRNNSELTGVSAEQLSLLKVAADYENPENDLGIAELEQEIDGVPIFRGSVKAGFTKAGEIVRVINNLAPGLDSNNVSRDFGDAQAAFHAAARHIEHEVSFDESTIDAGRSDADKVHFGFGDFDPTAEKIYFPIEPGVAIPAWRVLIWERDAAYYIIVDADDGTLLWRKNITDSQTQSATYNVWANPNAMINVAENPFPMTPGPSTLTGAQGAPLGRTMITRVGNEAPYSFNNNGWITDGGNTTDGNNVQAGLDRDTADGVDVGTGMPTGAARVFNYPINPGVPVPSGGLPAGDSPLPVFTLTPSEVDTASDLITVSNHGLPNGAIIRISTTSTLPAPLNSTTDYWVRSATQNQFALGTSAGATTAINLTSAGVGTHTIRVMPAPCGVPTALTDYQRAVITQLFYITNWYHDEMYRLGFTEAARNFQQDNFGRGGAGGDRVSAQAQDCSGTNNANFSTPADGSANPRGVMQMYIFTPPTPDFDGSLDADIVVHELTHGLSNRLHGNGSGLSGLNMSRAMGEGWSDFYAHAMLSEPSDPINGVYPTGGYATYNLRGGANLFNNYYYGIRRFPKAVMAFTGGPNNRPHNPMTFNDIDTTKINLSDGAFPAVFSTAADGVHAAGEVWSSALWEVRARYVQRLGWAVGNRRVLQHITDGMKLAPLAPTFLQERDAIIAAALASGSADDVADIWAGFAIRGMGASASIQNTGGSTSDGSGTGQTRVTEAFDLPNLQQTPDITVSDSTGDGDGFLEPGEPVRITVPLTNITGVTATNVSAQIVNGGNAFYGSIAHNGTASNQINFTIPAETACGAAVTITINVTSSLGPVSFQRTIQVGQAIVTMTENFDGVTAPSLPAGWTATPVLSGTNFVTTTNNANSAPNAAFAANPTADANAGGTDLTSPVTPITSQAAILSFQNRYDTEPGWDGGVLEISIGGGPFTDIIAAGGSFIENGYNNLMAAATSGNGYIANPLAGRNGWTGNSGGYLTTRVRLPQAAAGQNVQFKFRFGGDDNTPGVGPNPGWYIDNVQVFGQSACSFASNVKSRADFDGDGLTDPSVFRPSERKWYSLRSTEGIAVIEWGLDGDIITPGRWDSDNKTDHAVFRPSEGKWYILGSDGFTYTEIAWGLPGDQPVSGDYDGDGRNDPAVYRPSENRWYVLNIAQQNWGLPGDLPVPGDYTGDGMTDFAVFRRSTGAWHICTRTGLIFAVNWGLDGDKPVPADYDGDNVDDFAVWRPSNGHWYWVDTKNGLAYEQWWGLPGDVPVPGDYNGDGKDDFAVYRNGTWYQLRSDNTVAVYNWGFSSDLPIPAAYLPYNLP